MKSLVELSLGHFYDLLYRNRQKGDYGDLLHFEAAEVQPWLGEAQSFVEKVAAIVESRMQS